MASPVRHFPPPDYEPTEVPFPSPLSFTLGEVHGSLLHAEPDAQAYPIACEHYALGGGIHIPPTRLPAPFIPPSSLSHSNSSSSSHSHSLPPLMGNDVLIRWHSLQPLLCAVIPHSHMLHLYDVASGVWLDTSSWVPPGGCGPIVDVHFSPISPHQLLVLTPSSLMCVDVSSLHHPNPISPKVEWTMPLLAYGHALAAAPNAHRVAVWTTRGVIVLDTLGLEAPVALCMPSLAADVGGLKRSGASPGRLLGWSQDGTRLAVGNHQRLKLMCRDGDSDSYTVHEWVVELEREGPLRQCVYSPCSRYLFFTTALAPQIHILDCHRMTSAATTPQNSGKGAPVISGVRCHWMQHALQWMAGYAHHDPSTGTLLPPFRTDPDVYELHRPGEELLDVARAGVHPGVLMGDDGSAHEERERDRRGAAVVRVKVGGPVVSMAVSGGRMLMAHDASTYVRVCGLVSGVPLEIRPRGWAHTRPPVHPSTNTSSSSSSNSRSSSGVRDVSFWKGCPLEGDLAAFVVGDSHVVFVPFLDAPWSIR